MGETLALIIQAGHGLVRNLYGEANLDKYKYEYELHLPEPARGPRGHPARDGCRAGATDPSDARR